MCLLCTIFHFLKDLLNFQLSIRHQSIINKYIYIYNQSFHSCIYIEFLVSHASNLSSRSTMNLIPVFNQPCIEFEFPVLYLIGVFCQSYMQFEYPVMYLILYLLSITFQFIYSSISIQIIVGIDRKPLGWHKRRSKANIRMNLKEIDVIRAIWLFQIRI